MSDQPAPAPTLEAARTRAAVLIAATPANSATPTGRAAHGVLAALLYAAALDGDGLTRVKEWVDTDEREEPTRILAEQIVAAAAELGQTTATLMVHGPGRTLIDVEVDAAELRRLATQAISTEQLEPETSIGMDAPAVSAEEADSPEQAEIAAWAEHYISAESAEAFAEHVWTQWEEYEPDGSMSVGQMLRGLLRDWRGEEGGYPATPTA